MALYTDLNIDLTPEQIKERFSLFKVDQLAGGTFGSQDGTMDAYAVLMAYKKKAVALGAEFVVGEVIDVLKAEGQVQGVRLASGENCWPTT